MPHPTGFHYIESKFTSYCKRHAVNPVAPFALYRGFLTDAKEKQRYGWMTLAKEHREQLLKTGWTVLVSIYGAETMRQVMERGKK